jgi:hypothetical protein
LCTAPSESSGNPEGPQVVHKRCALVTVQGGFSWPKHPGKRKRLINQLEKSFISENMNGIFLSQ